MPDVLRTAGRYELLRQVGHGGMAVVYLARQTDLDRFVALKELRLVAAPDQTMAHRFLREARTSALLSHPNIVTVHEHFEFEGTPYIAMEYFDRGSLRPYVGRMTVPQIMGVLEGLLAGLDHATHHGVVHRDLKPENVMVTREGRVKIADFGIAKARNDLSAGRFVTVTGTTVGTPTYMAPEQAMAKDLGPYTDLYSVGVMAYEMLTGQVPFHDTDTPVAILLRHINDEIPPAHEANPEVDRDLSDWTHRLLAKDWKTRTPTAGQAWDELEDIVIGLFGSRWRRDARLPDIVPQGGTDRPLTPADFTATDSSGLPAVPGASTDGAGATEAAATGTGAASTGAGETGFESFHWDGQGGGMPAAPAPAAPEPAAPEPAAAPAQPVAPPAAAEPVAASDDEPAGNAAVEIPRVRTSAAQRAAAPAIASDVADPEADVAATPEADAEASGFETFAPDAVEETVAEAAVAEAAPSVEERVVEAPPVVEEPPVEEPVAEDAPAASGFVTFGATPAPPEAPAAPEPAAAEPVAEPEPEVEPAPVVEPEPEPEAPAPIDVHAATILPDAIPEPEPAAPEPREETPARERGEASKRSRILLAAATVAAIAGGAAAALATGGAEPAAEASATPSTPITGEQVGFQVPSGWSRGAVPQPSGLKLNGVVSAAPASGAENGVVAGEVDATTDAGLLPPGAIQGDRPTPEPVRLTPTVQALRYDDLTLRGANGPVTLFAIPTSNGTVALSCAGETDSETCGAIATTIALPNADPLPLGASEYQAKALATALNGLREDATAPAAALRSAKTRGGQGSAARRLGAAYRTAADAVDKINAGWGDVEIEQLEAALRQTATAWSALGQAASSGDAAGYARAKAAVARGDRAIRAARTSLADAGYTVKAG